MFTVTQRMREYVRKRAQDHMNSTISLYRYGSINFDDITGTVTVPDRDPIYSGKARVWQLNEGQVLVSGDADIATASTNISIPFDAALPKRDDIVVIRTCVQDPSIAGMAFRVMAVDGGGMIGAVRRMQCVALVDSGQWTEL